ncbi:MAG TPA: FUSC family protein [Rugosimonospora sp.]|nr:FUSC family protein [Rugosimonospora sp.]
MAVQMAVALGLAFTVGRLLFGQHWPWLVLSAYLVNSGNRGRGDVVYKGVQRVVGAGLGTVAATLAAGAFAPHDPVPVALIFVVLAVAGLLRRYSYAFWAAGVTGALSLLYGYFGATDPGILAHRLVALVTGAVLGVAAAWFVFPVRTHDVLRRRLADAYAALTDYLVATRRDLPALPGHHERFAHTLAELDRLSPTLRAHQRLIRLWHKGPHRADAVAALVGCGPATGELTRHLTGAQAPDRRVLAGLDGLRDDVVALRRAMAGRGPVPAPRDGEDHPHPALASLHTAVARTAATL